MLILVLFVEFPTFSNHKITHNASYFSKMSWKGDAIPTANLTKIFENEGVTAKEQIKAYFAEWKRLATFAPKYLRNFGANKC